MSDIVFGGGMGGARAAAVREGALLLEPSEVIGGRQAVTMPEDGGTASAANREAIADFYGAAPYSPALKPGEEVVFLDKQWVALPLNPWSVRGLVEKGDY